MEAFITEAEKVLELYPKLDLIEKSGIKILAGQMELLDSNQFVLDTYEIEIHPSKSKEEFPWVFETGGKLPVDIDWHVYEDTGRCCIKIPPEEELICRKGLTLIDFVKNELVPYFFNQTFRIENGYYINERSHGVKGLIEFYCELLEINNVKQAAQILGNILFREEPSRTAQCFCGKNEKYRRCHREARRQILSLNRNNVLSHLQVIIGSQK